MLDSYEALCEMESARTALRDAAWRYADSGRANMIGLEVEEAALRYVGARLVFEHADRKQGAK